MLQKIVDLFTYGLLQMDSSTRLGQSLNYFLYDSLKLLGLLFVLISIIGFIRSYIPTEKVRDWVGRKHKLVSHTGAALFGAITPFCSCSSIPIFLSFIEARIPLGVAFSFLITSPILNEYLFVLMFGYFGLKITVLYAVSGILIGIVSGLILGKLGLEKHLEQDLLGQNKEALPQEAYPDLRSRIKYGLNEGTDIVVKIWKWVILGVAVGALIHNYVPEEVIRSIVGAGGIWSVPIATLIGVPMYGSCAAIVPIAIVLFEKGVPLGTALAFMMAVSALSLPEAVILRRAMDLKLIAIFFGIVSLGIIFTGYLFNFLSGFLLT
ncbi:MAG: permease [Candidatus Margulisiibacteriota bacterium]|jgi:hypothetical protein